MVCSTYDLPLTTVIFPQHAEGFLFVKLNRDGGLRGLFTGVGPRVGRAGPSVGIVVSFYEVVKHALHRRYSAT